MIPLDQAYLDACESWDSAVQEGRLYGREDACPGLSVPADPVWLRWHEYWRTRHAKWEGHRAQDGARAAYGCPSVLGELPWTDCLPQVVGVTGGPGDCTGVLVAPDVVLSAGHCSGATEVVSSNTLVPDGDVKFRARRRVTRVVKHDHLDVALLQLDERLPFDPLIWPVTSTPLPDSLLIYGFGESQPGAGDFGSLLGVWFQDEDIVSCPSRGSARTGCRGREEFILSRPGRDTGFGDSGAPVLEKLGDGWRVVGVTSRSLAGGGTGDGGIYVRTDAISDWMVSSIRTLARL